MDRFVEYLNQLSVQQLKDCLGVVNSVLTAKSAETEPSNLGVSLPLSQLQVKDYVEYVNDFYPKKDLAFLDAELESLNLKGYTSNRTHNAFISNIAGTYSWESNKGTVANNALQVDSLFVIKSIMENINSN